MRARWIVLLAASCGVARAGLGHKPALDPDLQGYTFTGEDLCYLSGLRVTVQTDTRQGEVSVVAVMSGGSSDDPEGEEGLAHLAEHLWFRSRTPGGTTVDARLAQLGAVWNAH